MTDAPERIHVTASHDGDTGSWNKNPIDERFGLTQIEYIRADVAQAMVAAAYEVAAYECAGSNRGLTVEDVADDIRALTPTDARAALDAMLAKAREEREMFAWAMEEVAKAREDALREAANVCRDNAPLIEHDSTQDDRMHEAILERAARHIEALIDQTADRKT